MPAVPVMAQPAKVATPAVAVTGLVVQATRARAGGHAERDRAEAVVTAVLPEFSILTTGCAVNTTPLLVVPGVVVNASFRVPVMVMLPRSPVVSPVLVALRVKVAGGAGDLTPGEGGHTRRRGQWVGRAPPAFPCPRRWPG